MDELTCIVDCRNCAVPDRVGDPRFKRLLLDGEPVKVGYCIENDFFVMGEDGPENLDCQTFEMV